MFAVRLSAFQPLRYHLIRFCAGGTPLLGRAGAHSARLGWDDVVRADPDVLLVAPCGFGLAQTRRELGALRAQPGFERWARARRVRILDGNQYFNRPGPRLVESLEILCEVLHPEAFAFGHEATGWEPLDLSSPH